MLQTFFFGLARVAKSATSHPNKFFLLWQILLHQVKFTAAETPLDHSPAFVLHSRRNHFLQRSFSIGTTPAHPMKLEAPAAQRNKEPIWNVLSSKVLPTVAGNKGSRPVRVLEIAAGSGVHTEHFARQLIETKIPFVWYPTDLDLLSRQSIEAYIRDSKLDDFVQSPIALTLDANGIMESETRSILQKEPIDVITCINMIHISPWEATLGLLKVSGELLSEDGILYCYGPYKVGGTAVESNLYVYKHSLLLFCTCVSSCAPRFLLHQEL